jgi:hypothetical protein
VILPSLELSPTSRLPQGADCSTKKEETIRTLPPVADAVIYHGLLGEIVQTVDAGDHTEADPVGVLVTLLAGAGVLIGPGPHVQIASIQHPLLIWSLLFGSTGTGRKGESEGTARLFLAKVPGFPDIWTTGLSSGEGLIERLRDPKDEDDSGGTDDKRLLVIESEFSSVMARTKREGSTLAAVLRQAWDGDALSVLNRSALTASGSHVAVVGHVTPREFCLRLAETEMTGGTYNRFLPIFVDRSKRLPLPEPVPGDTIKWLGGQLATAIENARGDLATRVTLSAPARELWKETLYDEFTGTDDTDEVWTQFIRRAAPYCLRIAALHAVLAGRNSISTEDLAAAGGLVRYSIASARYVLDRQARDPRLDRIRRAVIAKPDGLTRSAVSGLFSRNLSGDVLDELLDKLIEGPEFEVLQVRTGGRPATCYRRTRSPAEAPVVSSFFVPPSPAEADTSDTKPANIGIRESARPGHPR